MAYSTTILYPEDLNGTNPLNLITNEIHNLQPPGPKDFYFIIPFAAPFFVESLEVYNVATGAKYVEGTDYLVGHRFIEAMASIGRPIAGSIRFLRFDIVGQVRLRYRTIGGPWGFSDQAILRELANVKLNPIVRSWGDIDVLPYSFPPLLHDQPLNSLIGSAELKASLDHIADVMEATASGTTQSHLVDYNNPHRVTKQQVLLGNVPNFAMATDEQMVAAQRADLFTNPRGVLLSIQEYALKPLNAHINATGNVHRMVPADIGLGNVPNYPAATPAQAIDPTNTTTLLTPYTGALLVQKLNNDPRLDQLIIDFNNHLTAVNPHHITPAMIGTLTAQEIEQKIAAAGGGSGGDAATFAGLTPAQWEDKFPVNADINQMLTETAEIYANGVRAINLIDMSDPVGPEQIAQRNALKINSAFGEYGAYGLYNSLNDLRVVASTQAAGGYPTTVVANAENVWSSNKNANYYVSPAGGASSWGTAAVPIPAKYAGTPTAANKTVGVWSGRDNIWLQLDTGNLIRVNRDGSEVVEITGKDILDCRTNNGLVDPRPFGVAILAGDSITIEPFGDAGWKQAVNTVISGWGSQKYMESRISNEYINFITSTGTAENQVTYLRIYKINYGATITLTEVTNQINLYNHGTGATVAANTVRGVTHVAGSYTHSVFTLPRAGTAFSDLLSYGDGSQGQLAIPLASAPFLSIAAGYEYTITINKMNFVEFWGNSPDNSLLYRGGAFLEVPNVNKARA